MLWVAPGGIHLTRFFVFCMQIGLFWSGLPYRPDAPKVEKLSQGIRVGTGDGFLTIEPKSDFIVRVVHSRERDPRVDDMVVVGPGNSLGANSPSHNSDP